MARNVPIRTWHFFTHFPAETWDRLPSGHDVNPAMGARRLARKSRKGTQRRATTGQTHLYSRPLGLAGLRLLLLLPDAARQNESPPRAAKARRGTGGELAGFHRKRKGDWFRERLAKDGEP